MSDNGAIAERPGAERFSGAPTADGKPIGAGAGHLVQFYEDDAQLSRDVSQYLAEGLRNSDAIVVIATTAHRECFSSD